MTRIQERFLQRYKKASTAVLIAEHKAASGGFTEKQKLEVREARGYSRAMRESCLVVGCPHVLIEDAYFQGLQEYRKQYPSEKAPVGKV